MILAETEYYRVVCVLSERHDTEKWLASIRVIRRDTDEYVKMGFTIFSPNKEDVVNSAMQRATESLLPQLGNLGKPTEWHSRTRHVILRCKKLKAEIVSFGNYIADNVLLGGNTKEYWEKYAVFWKKITKESIALSSEIETLDEEERLGLLILPEDAVNDPSDAWSLEELDSRIMVFDFFLKSTEREKQVHEEQKKKLSDRYEELGWSEQRSNSEYMDQSEPPPG